MGPKGENSFFEGIRKVSQRQERVNQVIKKKSDNMSEEWIGEKVIGKNLKDHIDENGKSVLYCKP